MSDDVIRAAVARLALKLRSRPTDPLLDCRDVAALLSEIATHSTPAAGFELTNTARELWRRPR